MTTIYMPLSFTKPPLTMNQRMHWAQKSPITRRLREEAHVRAKAMKVGHHGHVTVRLHYQAADNRRRDEDNLTPTFKALCDGLVDAGVVDDDTSDYMTKLMPRIHAKEPGEPARCWLVIEVNP